MENEEQTKEKIHWHEAFFAAIQMELHEYKKSLTYQDEYQLSEKPLRIDVLIIKKLNNIEILKNIAKIFKKHNIIEFKSEKDSLTIWDYKLVIAYALVYSSTKQIPLDHITISFFVTKYPKKVVDFIKNNRKLELEEVQPGIYYVQGEIITIQIIESKKLSEKDNLFIKNLRSNLKASELNKTLENIDTKKYELNLIESYLDKIMSANKEIICEVLDMSAEVDQIIENYIEKRGFKQKFMQKALEQGIEQGIEQGREKEKILTTLEMLRDKLNPLTISKYVQMPVSWVEDIKNKMLD